MLVPGGGSARHVIIRAWRCPAVERRFHQTFSVARRGGPRGWSTILRIDHREIRPHEASYVPAPAGACWDAARLIIGSIWWKDRRHPQCRYKDRSRPMTATKFISICSRGSIAQRNGDFDRKLRQPRFYNRERHRTERHLAARSFRRSAGPDGTVEFSARERTIHTRNSINYTLGITVRPWRAG